MVKSRYALAFKLAAPRVGQLTSDRAPDGRFLIAVDPENPQDLTGYSLPFLVGLSYDEMAMLDAVLEFVAGNGGPSSDVLRRYAAVLQERHATALQDYLDA